MNKKTTKSSDLPTTIALNRKARHEYTIEQKYETGLVLQGWEIKGIRAGKMQIADSYVVFRRGEPWLLGSLVNPLLSASTHITTEPDRTRKLLLTKREINTLLGLVERKGYTLIPLALYWKGNKIKLEIGLAKGKKSHDKRDVERDRDWQREKQRLFKKH
jgi:SsrA-binding protein